MIRTLKILVAAAMALAAVGAIGASGVQAAEFHCGVQPCTMTVKPDGKPGPTGKTAHQVFILKQGGTSLVLTCQQLTGEATSETKTFKTLTLKSIQYHTCPFLGETVTFRMNGCEYHFEVGGIHHAGMQIKCPEGQSIEIEIPATGCLLSIGETGALTGGLTFKDAETEGTKKTEITAETTVTNIPTTVNNKCPGGLKEGAATGEITTGNFELTAEEDGTEKHTTLWWE